MSRLGRKRPCRECPYRRTSPAGWLGSDHPTAFVGKSYVAEVDMPCHMAIDYTDPDWATSQEPDADMCAGALILLANDHKLPREPRMSDAVRAVEPDCEQVFASPGEFLAHHTGDERYATVRGRAQAAMDQWAMDRADL